MIEEAIILAAGMGTRIGLPTPKCLIKVGNRSLLDYQLEALSGISKITIVTGYKHEFIQKHIHYYHQDKISKIKLIYNSEYEKTSNVYSLSLVTKMINRPTLITMSDLIIKPESFDDFIRHTKDETTLIAVTRAKSADAIFVKWDGHNIVDIGRHIQSDFEWVGMLYVQQLKIYREKQFVYELIKDHLPANGIVIKSLEIDTSNDYDYVKKSYRRLLAKNDMLLNS